MREQEGYGYQRSGSWYWRWRETVIENGQPVRRHMAKKIAPVAPEHKRLKRPPPEIEKLAKELLRPINAGTISIQSTQDLVEFVEQTYFPSITQQHHASTVTGYRNRWRAYLKARCVGYRLREFRTVHGQQILNDIARQHPTLLRSTLSHLKALLSGIFTEAIRLGILDGQVSFDGNIKTVVGNPMRGVKVPKAPKGPPTHAYSLEEIGRILTVLHAMSGSPAAFVVAATIAFAGLRRSELRGLRWEDYDGSELSIRRSAWELYIEDTKTADSEASVPVIGILAKILNAWREHCGNPEPSCYIFRSSKGTPLNINNLEKRLIRPVLREAGVAWHGWHAFRRGLGTNLHEMGVDDLVIQRILRHANVKITQAYYIKTAPASAVAAMQLFETQASALCANCAQAFTERPVALLQ